MVPDSPANDSGDTYTFQYSSDRDDQPLIAIVESVAWVNGVDARDLKPLHHVIAVDTLNELMRDPDAQFARGSVEATGLTVTFQYEGCLVTVTPDEIAVKRA